MESTNERHNGARPRPPRPTELPRTSATLTRIRDYKDEAFLYIQQGLSCDEQGQGEQALVLYKRGLTAMSSTCAEYDLACRMENTDTTSWQSIHDMMKQMHRTKQRIQLRVEELERTDASVARSIHDPPPTYEQSLTPSSDGDIDFDLVDGGENDLNRQIASNATEVFKIPEGVQIFFITREGMVSAPSYPSSLAIYKFAPTQDSTQVSAPAFLKVGSWTYPLLPGHSPVLHASYGAYMFPDVTSADPGASVGLLLPDSVTAAQKTRFENVLNELTDFKEQAAPARPPPPTATTHRPATESTSDKISEGIVSAAGWLSSGLTTGAEKAGNLLRRGSASLRQRLTPEQEPTHIDPQYQKGMEYAKKATGAAVKVTGFLVVKLAQGTAALARELAPHVRAGSEKYLPESFTKKGSDGQSKIDDITKVAHGGLKGFGALHIALESAAISLGKVLSEETKSVVSHKYGDEAGQFAGNAMGTGVNTVLTVGIASNIGARMVAKTAVKQYARGLAVDEKDGKTEEKKLQCEADREELMYYSKQDQSHPTKQSTPANSKQDRAPTSPQQASASTILQHPGAHTNQHISHGPQNGHTQVAPRSQPQSQDRGRLHDADSLYPQGTAPPRLHQHSNIG